MYVYVSWIIIGKEERKRKRTSKGSDFNTTDRMGGMVWSAEEDLIDCR